MLADSSSVHSDEDNYDDVKSTVANYQSARSQHYDQYRPAISPGAPSNPVSSSQSASTYYIPIYTRSIFSLFVCLFVTFLKQIMYLKSAYCLLCVYFISHLKVIYLSISKAHVYI